MTIAVIVELIIHVILIEVLNRIAKKSQWLSLAPLAFLVSGFIILIILTIPVITPSGLNIVSGQLASTGQDENGWFVINLTNHTLQFVVSGSDDEYFEKEKFLANVHPGDLVILSILKRAENSEESYRSVFDIESKGFVYLSHEPLLESRLQERKITFPIVITISILLGLCMLIAWRNPNPISDLALSAFLGTLIMIALDALFRESNIPGVLPTIYLAFIYPIIWIIENWRHPLTKKDWLINLAVYILMIGLVTFSYLITLIQG
jgi:hypothetical protein